MLVSPHLAYATLVGPQHEQMNYELARECSARQGHGQRSPLLPPTAPQGAATLIQKKDRPLIQKGKGLIQKEKGLLSERLPGDRARKAGQREAKKERRAHGAARRRSAALIVRPGKLGMLIRKDMDGIRKRSGFCEDIRFGTEWF